MFLLGLIFYCIQGRRRGAKKKYANYYPKLLELFSLCAKETLPEKKTNHPRKIPLIRCKKIKSKRSHIVHVFVLLFKSSSLPFLLCQYMVKKWNLMLKILGIKVQFVSVFPIIYKY